MDLSTPIGRKHRSPGRGLDLAGDQHGPAWLMLPDRTRFRELPMRGFIDGQGRLARNAAPHNPFARLGNASKAREPLPMTACDRSGLPVNRTVRPDHMRFIRQRTRSSPRPMSRKPSCAENAGAPFASPQRWRVLSLRLILRVDHPHDMSAHTRASTAAGTVQRSLIAI